MRDAILTHSIYYKGHCCFKSSKIISTTKCRTSLRLSACQIMKRCLQAYLSFMKSLSSNINPPIFDGASDTVLFVVAYCASRWRWWSVGCRFLHSRLCYSLVVFKAFVVMHFMHRGVVLPALKNSQETLKRE